MTYKTVSRIKTGSKEDGFEYIEHGEPVTAKAVGGKEAFEELLEAGVLVDEKEYDRLFPEKVEGANQPSGTPSNLAVTEGTTLQAEEMKPGNPDVEEAPVVNPADPPHVEKAGTGDGFDTEGNMENPKE